MIAIVTICLPTYFGMCGSWRFFGSSWATKAECVSHFEGNDEWLDTIADATVEELGLPLGHPYLYDYSVRCEADKEPNV